MLWRKQKEKLKGKKKKLKNKKNSLVSIIMGSKSDWSTMKFCSDTLKKFNILHEVRVISAYRTPNRLHKFLNEAKKKILKLLLLELAELLI